MTYIVPPPTPNQMRAAVVVLTWLNDEVVIPPMPAIAKVAGLLSDLAEHMEVDDGATR